MVAPHPANDRKLSAQAAADKAERDAKALAGMRKNRRGPGGGGGDARPGARPTRP